MQRFYIVIAVAVLSLVLGAGSCWNTSLNAEEARVAVDEIALSGQALNLASGSIEIATDFTIGQAVEAAAQEIKEFIESQLPCAWINLSGATLTIEYGVYEGECTYNGQEYSGKHTITVESAAPERLIVDHFWTNFTNGLVSVTGHATVTWSAADSSRKVEHILEWTRASDGKTANSSGVRTETVLLGGIVEGIKVDGSVDWVTEVEQSLALESENEGNEWNLDIDNVELRWIDPVPQSGTYSLDTQFDKSAELTFERVDEDTIAVTVSSGNKSFTFNVSKSGGVSEG
jgi:hypothetical protein